MPSVAILGSVDSGHGGFSPGTVSSGQGLFTVNGIAVAGTGDISVTHVQPNTPPHDGVLVGSSKLTVNSVTIAMVGDPTSCGASIASGDDTMTIT